jgi:hypothetical protein
MRHSETRSILEFCGTLLTFGLVGPPVGFLTLDVFMMIHQGKFSPPYSPIGELLVWSYLFGGVFALLAGLCVAIQERPRWRSVLLVGLIIGSIFSALAGLSSIGSLPQGADFKTQLQNISMFLAASVSTCLVPTVVCWLIVRGLAALSSAPGRVL